MKKSHQQGNAQIIIIVTVVIALLGSLGFVFWQNFVAKAPVVKNFEQCKAAPDSVIQESYPEVCVTKDGARFVNPNQKVKQEIVSSLPQDINFKTEANPTGVTLVEDKDVDALSDVDHDLKTFLKSELAKDESNGCYTVINLTRVYKQKYAIGNQGVGGDGCGGGFAALWALSNGSWKRVMGAQQAPMCDAIGKLISENGLNLEDLEVVGWDMCYANENSTEAQHYKAVQQ